MALFKVNTGLREQEVVQLSWHWEVQVPELDTSIFVVPKRLVKNGLDRYVLLNRVARSVIESSREKRSERVFTRDGRFVTKIYNSGWKKARERAAKRYQTEFGRPCPEGFSNLRVHDLKHTFGHRLRAVGIGFEDRKVLLGHKTGHVTAVFGCRDLFTDSQHLASRTCQFGYWLQDSRHLVAPARQQALADSHQLFHQICQLTGG